MKLTGSVAVDWQGVSIEQQLQCCSSNREAREKESSEVGCVKITIYIIIKICNPKVKLRRFIVLFIYLFFKIALLN